jgi:predicted O-methyltransferase YrrM
VDPDTIEDFFDGLLVEPDPVLDAVLRSAREAGLPPHDVTPSQGKLLHLLARAVGAKRILEVGTLAGYSTIWLARALPADGSLTTIERDPRAAEVARANLERAGVTAAVELIEGDAREVLATLEGTFDLVFLDADKRSNPIYLGEAMRLVRPGSLVVADNVVRGGEVANADTEDPDARGVREFARAVGDDPRLEATAIQTVGTKGHDGFVVALVTS